MLADRTQFKLSKTLEIFQKMPFLNQERIKMGLEPVIDLGMGQPHLPVNPIALEALAVKLQDENLKKEFGYSAIRGQAETLEAIAEFYREYYPTMEYGTDEVMCTQGANQALWNALSIFIQEKNGKKDKVLAFTPYFGQYLKQVTALGGEFIAISTDQTQLRPSAQALGETLRQNPDAKALILNFPNNPSGISLSFEEYQEMVKVLENYPEIVLILDEVYRWIHFKPYVSILDVTASLKNNSILIHSVSKGLIGAPGMRIGMTAAPAKWMPALSQQQLLTTLSVPLLSQIVLSYTLKKRNSHAFKEWELASIKTYQDNLETLYEGLKKIGFRPIQKPEGGIYLLINASCLLGTTIPHEIILPTHTGSLVLNNLPEKIGATRLSTDREIAAFLLHVAGVAMIPASEFGIEASQGYLRASFAVEKKHILRAIQSMAQIKNLILNMETT